MKVSSYFKIKKSLPGFEHSPPTRPRGFVERHVLPRRDALARIRQMLALKAADDLLIPTRFVSSTAVILPHTTRRALNDVLHPRVTNKVVKDGCDAGFRKLHGRDIDEENAGQPLVSGGQMQENRRGYWSRDLMFVRYTGECCLFYFVAETHVVTGFSVVGRTVCSGKRAIPRRSHERP